MQQSRARFIDAEKYQAVDLADLEHKNKRNLFTKNGFVYDDKFSNLALSDGGPEGVVYTDTVSPWRYKWCGTAYEHTSRNGLEGLGGYECIYEPIAFFDEAKIMSAIGGLSDKGLQNKALSYLERLNILLANEKEYWQKKKKKIMAYEDSFWDKDL